MLARINLLFAFSISTLLVFYFVGRFILVRIVAAASPALLPYFIAAYTLAALMLTVLILAKTTVRLGGFSMAARANRAGARFFVSQLMLYSAHLALIVAIYAMFLSSSDGQHQWAWLLAPLLYAAGIYLAVIDLRKRAAQTGG